MIIQGDKTVLLEVNGARYAAARDALARFAELEKSPEYIHTYRITPLSLWNAASAGLSAAAILGSLNEFAKYPVPANVAHEIQEYISRYGCIKLLQVDDELHLVSDDPFLIRELLEHKAFRAYILQQLSPTRLVVHPVMRGHIKQVLVQLGYPAEDLAGYVEGDPLAFDLRAATVGGAPFTLRGYQQEAAAIFYAAGSAQGGSGTIVLPCGAGKTIVGLAAMHSTTAPRARSVFRIHSSSRCRRAGCACRGFGRLAPAVLTAYRSPGRRQAPACRPYSRSSSRCRRTPGSSTNTSSRTAAASSVALIGRCRKIM